MRWPSNISGDLAERLARVELIEPRITAGDADYDRAAQSMHEMVRK